MLTDLVAQRSKITERSRLSLTLNDAIAKAGSIPEPDLNTLSLIFLFQNVQNNGLINLESLAEFMASTVEPLLSNISTSDSAVSYLAAHGCVLPPSGISIQQSAMEILLHRYGSILTKGATEAALRGKFSDYDSLVRHGLVVNSPYGNSLKTFLYCGPQLEPSLHKVGLFGAYVKGYEEVTKDAKPSEQEFTEVMCVHMPSISDLLATYNTPSIRDSRLTSIGIALAHANLANGPFRDVDLSVWIKS
jgi:hypothetical protein